MECLQETGERIIATIVRGSAAGTDVEDLMKTHKSSFCTAGQADETTGVHCSDDYFPRKSHPIPQTTMMSPCFVRRCQRKLPMLSSQHV